jgi:hypothetical protein
LALIHKGRVARIGSPAAVAEITERVKSAGLSGKLKRWNAAYKQYRLAQLEKSEPAIPYSAFLEQVVIMPTVRQLAASGRMI